MVDFQPNAVVIILLLFPCLFVSRFNAYSWKFLNTLHTKCVFSNANPLHYWCFGFRAKRIDGVLVWSILNSRTACADHITCGNEYLYSVLEEVKVRMTVQCNCVVWDEDERKGEGETRCWLMACSSRKAPRGPPGLTSPFHERISINSTICLLNIYIYTVEGFGI